MKAAFLGLLLALVASADDSTNSRPATEVMTNMVTAHPSFRRVDGKLYNTQQSVLWFDVKGEHTKTLTNGSIIQELVDKFYYGRPRSDSLSRVGNMLGSGGNISDTRPVSKETVPGKELFIRNYPVKLKLAIGDKVSFRAIRVGTFDYEGTTYQMWDYGTPNIVPVVVTNTLPH